MPSISTKVDSYKVCILDFQFFLNNKQRDREEQILQEDAKNKISFGPKKCPNHQYILKTSKIPHRIKMLYQKGTAKIALERKRDTAMSNKESHEREPAEANERQLALYKQGVAKIRQQRQSAYKSQHQSDPVAIKTAKGINRRQQSLYLLGVKKLRERNRKDLVVLSQVPNGKRHYNKRMYQVLPNFIAKMEHPVPFSETLSTEILESYSNKLNMDPMNTPHLTSSRTITAIGPFSGNYLSTDLGLCSKLLHGPELISVRGCDRRSFSEVSCDNGIMDTMLEIDDNQSKEKGQGVSEDIEAKYQERGETILRISSRLVVLVVIQKETMKDTREIELCIVV